MKKEKKNISTNATVIVTTPNKLNSIIKAARNIMRKDKGLNGDLDRLPQLTWMMFLKFLDDNEKIRESEAKLAKNRFISSIEKPYRWRDWAYDKQGITGDALTSFVNNDEAILPDGTRGSGLLEYLSSLQGSNGLDRKAVVATVFQGAVNKMRSGYLLRDVINKLNEINFTSSDEIHVLSYLYESILKELRDAAGDSGEFYTPRSIVKFMVKMIDPKLNETVLDPAAGTGGFLIESYLHLKPQCKNTDDRQTLQFKTLHGIEAKSLPYMLCQMNLLLHGIDYPKIDPLNALRSPLHEIGDKERVDIIVTNPPFGGEEEPGILSNFPSDKQTNETALLFLQLIMRKLRRPSEKHKPGRCAIVLPNGNILSGTGTSERIRRDLLENFNLHTIIQLPMGVFSPYTIIPTNLFFFDRSGSTKEIWFYEIPHPQDQKQYSKTRPLTFEELDPVVHWWNNRVESKYSWKVSAEEILDNNCNLEIKNPYESDEIAKLSTKQILENIINLEKKILDITQDIQKILK